jgi:4-alpha-glucanotransferase
MGGTPDSAPPRRTARPITVRPGERRSLPGPGDLVLEDRAVLRVGASLPADLPLGYHELRPLDGSRSVRVIVAPAACHLPAGLREWGWAVQLYAARSRESWGIGDLGDLRRLAGWARRLGAGLLLINPLHAATPVVPQQPSPYCPSSRRFRNFLYLRVEDVPGAAEAGLDLERLAAEGRRLNAERLIDRDAVLRLKLEALERLWRRFGTDPAFEAFRAEQGAALADWAAFCTLAQQFGPRWREWPEPYRRPGTPAVARFVADHADRVEFHRWLQWLLDLQLEAASRQIRLMQDLPIGVDPDGADAWAWQDVLTTEATVGAPPDRYNAAGQNWGLPAWIPHRLAEAGFDPFIETIRATVRHGGGLRIDHVMGLFRLFWIPRGLPASDGAYVRYPVDDLLAIVALESQRARAVVVGEDLGTVEAGVRERLAEHAILSYRLLWFEEDRPSAFPQRAMAAITTHDLPTVRGLWSGADLEAQASTGQQPNEKGFAAMRDRLRTMAGLDEDAPIDAVIERAHRLLAEAPSMLVTATLDDALAVEERPNMPGTVTEWPNWRLALPEPIERLGDHPLVRSVAGALGARRSGGTAFA